MKLQQLKLLREIVRQDFNLTRAAHEAISSQPAVTRHLQLLEEELGVKLLERHKGRFVGLTEQGKVLLPIMTQALDAVDNLSSVARELSEGATGILTVGTANTYTRYTLPAAITRFVGYYPNVMLRIKQGYEQQAIQWVSSGEVDFSISTLPEKKHTDLDFYPCYEMHRILLTPPGHPLLEAGKISLADIARYPIITYDRTFPARTQLVRVFERHGIPINIALSGTDTEIVKTYVAAGLGVGVVGDTAFDAEHDVGLRMIDVRHLFKSITAHVAIRKEAPLSPHALKLLELFAPKVRKALSRKAA